MIPARNSENIFKKIFAEDLYRIDKNSCLQEKNMAKILNRDQINNLIVETELANAKEGVINKKEIYEKLTDKLKKEGFPINELFNSVYSMNGLIKDYNLGIISPKCLRTPIRTPEVSCQNLKLSTLKDATPNHSPERVANSIKDFSNNKALLRETVNNGALIAEICLDLFMLNNPSSTKCLRGKKK